MSADRFEKKVARVGVLGDAAARQRRAEAVDRAAAVGVDQAADEVAGVAVDDRLLPGFERDRTLVLATRAVLREGVQPELA
jgi:hypothetical protein